MTWRCGADDRDLHRPSCADRFALANLGEAIELAALRSTVTLLVEMLPDLNVGARRWAMDSLWVIERERTPFPDPPRLVEQPRPRRVYRRRSRPQHPGGISGQRRKDWPRK